MHPKLTGAARTDVGLRRENNEDAHLFDDALGLYLLADGMGGHAAGDVASRMVVETVSEYIRHFLDKPAGAPDRFPLRDETLSDRANTVLQAIQLANQVVHQAAENKKAYHGMGSTVVLLLADGKDLLLAHVGDSRAYRSRSGRLERLSVDHRLAEDPQFKGVIENYESTMIARIGHTLTRAMGVHPQVAPDIQRLEVLPGDLFLLCSDGLYDMVSAEMIAQVLAADEDLAAKSGQLVDLALAGGGKDNVTVILAEASGRGRKLKGLLSRISQGRPSAKKGKAAGSAPAAG
jgi:protein phosphatase